MEETATTGNNLVKTITGTIPQDLSTFTEDVEQSFFSKPSTWFMMLVCFALLGGVVFIYLAKGEQSFYEYIIHWGKIVKKEITPADNLGKESSCKNPSRDKIMKALDNAAQTEQYLADDASSNIQQTGKSKWCFVGDEKGTRNCVQLDESQTCMSGDIFPSRDVCINPKIRS